MKSLDAFRKIVAGELPGPPVADLIGIRMTEAEPGRVVFELDAGPQHASPLGTVHGGIICDLADAALGCAHASLLEDGETFTTLELKMNFLKPVWAGRLVAEARSLKFGRTVGAHRVPRHRRARLARRLRDVDADDAARGDGRGPLTVDPRVNRFLGSSRGSPRHP